MTRPPFDHAHDTAQLTGGLEAVVQCCTGRIDTRGATERAMAAAEFLNTVTSWDQLRPWLLARLREHVAALERYAPNPEAN